MSQKGIGEAKILENHSITNLRLTSRLYRWVGASGGIILLALVLVALFPSLIAPYDPTESVSRPFQSPDKDHLLGTNDIGQDLFSELVWSTRISLATGVIVGLTAVGIGSIVGLSAGYYDNLGSTALMRLVDRTLALPFLPLVILLSAYLGASSSNVIIILILVSWAALARLIRSRVLETVNQPYVESAVASGGSDNRPVFSREFKDPWLAGAHDQ